MFNVFVCRRPYRVFLDAKATREQHREQDKNTDITTCHTFCVLYVGLMCMLGEFSQVVLSYGPRTARPRGPMDDHTFRHRVKSSRMHRNAHCIIAIN